MKVQLLIILCIPWVCLGIQCNLTIGKFFCDGTDKYNFTYHFYRSRPESFRGEIEIINSYYPTLEQIDVPQLESTTATITGLTIKKSSVEVVKDKAFSNLWSLNSLDLSRNKISSMNFELPSQLKYLNLSYNFLHLLDIDSLNSNMQSIDFSYNFINELRHRDWHRIIHANFSNNEITKFDTEELNCRFIYLNVENKLSKSVELSTKTVEQLRVTFIGTFSAEGISNPYLKKLVVSNSDINTLQEDSFLGMFYLTELHFPNTTVHSVTSRAFNGLFNLKHLDSQALFKGSRILKNETFHSLISLRQLNLSNLSLENIELNAFFDLTSLESLLLNNNSLSQLNPGLFQGLSSVTYLDLSYNKISICPSKLFRGLEALNKLFLNNNNISVLTGNTFSGLQKLKELYLQKNQIKWLPKHVFSHLKNLRILYLNDNIISNIHPYNFNGLSHLLKLHLQNNEIKQLPREFFEDLNLLEELRLDNNELVSLERESFMHFNNLILLNISKNKIENYNFPNWSPVLQIIA